MKKMVLDVCAKINLSLDVIGKREDGYHLLSMIMQSVNLKDRIFVERIPNKPFTLKTNHSKIPTDDGNIICKAIKVYCDETKIDDGYQIFLDKKIPIEAGMAGGSADAAGTLLALNRLNGNILTMEELSNLALQIGTDIPFSFLGGTCLAEGIGEKLTKLPDVDLNLLVIKPDKGVSTREVYTALEWEKIKKHPNNNKIMELLASSQQNDIFPYMENVLYEVSKRFVPEIEDIIVELEEKFFCPKAMMSGSGSAVFGIFMNLEDMEKAYNYFSQKYHSVYKTKTVKQSIYEIK